MNKITYPAAPVSLPTYEELAADLKTARATIRVMDKNKAEYLARNAELESAAPVSGQGASELHEALDRLIKAWGACNANDWDITQERMKARAALVELFDSRPRSEEIEQAHTEGWRVGFADQCNTMKSNKHYRERVFNQIVELDTAEGLHRFARSEDSRAKVLSDAITWALDSMRTNMPPGVTKVLKEALASTTPPKADNE